MRLFAWLSGFIFADVINTAIYGSPDDMLLVALTVVATLFATIAFADWATE